ncbi:hypothetical protein [uncultured Stenotrophomonas sp.]|uniref:hypothetical protein n=1 Tax=uncultured Stenotrophomonas sp. TaxID=165438 RepID=UPI0025D1B8F9|nr:hypothetical protein [uncultured Stenotrophomonas sp.]
MSDQMTRIQQEAEDRYPLDRRQVMFSGEPSPRPERAAFIAGRTISADQLEQAAEAAYASTGSPIAWEVVSKPQRQTYRKQARAALEAAGLVIEE